jgi:hypothetical protein
MTPGQAPARTYGGWRRSRSIGLLGLGPAAIFTMLGCLAALLLVAAVSFRALAYVAPPMALAGVASLIRIGGVPLAQVAVQRLRWWHGSRAGHATYRAEVVLCHGGELQLPGTLAATELLSAEDGRGGRYGLVRDQWQPTGEPERLDDRGDGGRRLRQAEFKLAPSPRTWMPKTPDR